MARRSSTPAADPPMTAQLGDLDKQGLERLPDFGAPSHEAVVADLDARDERLNGHTEVRPSERCGLRSSRGISCTARDEHDGPHSWQEPGYDLPAPAESTSVATSTDESPANQATLPGTPEPDTSDDTTIPTETVFSGKDFVSAPGLKALGERLIDDHAELADLQGVEIRYLWKRRGGTSGGNPKLGALQRPGGLLRYFTGGVTFVAWLAADNIRSLQLDATKIEACLFHQLSHAELDPDDDDAWRIRGHSFEGFVEELDHYGVWNADLREAAAHIRLLPLDQALAEAADDGEADEGEESE